jgi:CBS domain containing-hemolysin-like protein
MKQSDRSSPPEPAPHSLLKRLLHIFGIDKSPDTAEDLDQEFQDLIEDGEELGLISSQEGMMLNSIIDFRDTLVKEIMTPRTEMVCASAASSIPELIALITEKGVTRLPIYKDSPDHIAGILHAKDLLQYCTSNAHLPAAGDIVKPALFVLDNHKIIDLLPIFKKKKLHMAIVTDEFGTVRGLITLEDIIEEIIGEITDESDKENTRWKVVDQNTILTDAKIDIEEIEDFFNIELPEGPYESVGGLVINQLGRLAASGDSVQLDCLRFQVISASKRRIDTVKVQRVC